MGIIHERRKQQKNQVRVYAPPAVPVSPPVIRPVLVKPVVIGPVPARVPPPKPKVAKKRIERRDIYVAGYPRSGTVWLSRLLGDALNCPVGSMHGRFEGSAGAEGFGRTGPYRIKQGHSTPQLLQSLNVKGENVIYILRDPRDVIVSAHHYFGSRQTMMNFITTAMKGQMPMIFGGGMGNFIPGWVNSRMYAYMTSYEALSSDTGSELERIVDALGICAVKDIGQVVFRQSFGQRKIVAQNKGDSMPHGKQYQIRFLRKGIVGDWRNVFNRRTGAHFDNLFGEALIDLGYCDDRDWWASLKE